MKALLLALSIFGFTFLQAQSVDVAKKTIKVLTSPDMKGRGYVGGGDRKAATYIAHEFEKLGLKKYTDQYFQRFHTPVNSFPGKMELTLNKTKLIPGKDFLIDPASPGIHGRFKVVLLKATDLLHDSLWIPKMMGSEGKFLVVENYHQNDFNKDEQDKMANVIGFLQYHPDNKASGTILLTDSKLTWSGSTKLFYKPSITVRVSPMDEPIESVQLKIENHFHQEYQTQNVIGYLEGENKDSLIVLTAHYDHLGMMGSNTLFPGANDNASGVALLLNLASYFAHHKPRNTIVFVAFAAEEIGLVGSKYFVDHPLFPLEQIKFLINFDLAGTGDDGIQVVNGKIFSKAFTQLVHLNESLNLLKEIKVRGEACNSDHCFFYRKNVPCFFIYTLGGIQAYHDVYDIADTLPLTAFDNYSRLMIEFLKVL